MTQAGKGSSFGRAYCYGMVAASTLHRLEKPFPPPDGYSEIAESHFQTGGEAANSAIALRRLGMRVRLDGNWIGSSREGAQLLALLRRERIDVSRLRVKKDFPGAREIVFADRSSRTVFGNYGRVLFTTRQWNKPRKADLAWAQVANIDPFFGAESVLAAEFAAELKIPYVTVDCAPESPIAGNAAAVVISGEFLAREYPRKSADRMMDAYRSRVAGLTIFTGGAGVIRYARGGGGVRRMRPPAIEAVDTTGAGDAFRAGVAAGLLRGWDDAGIIAYASAVGALVCLTLPGVLGAPNPDAVDAFLKGKISSSLSRR
jgi:sugar/nucleoside kinase (ribokinase family)